jgi:hypothetical protein
VDYSHYPDVTAAGSLRAALQHQLDLAGSALRAQHASAPGWRFTAAVVHLGDRHANAHLISGDRTFLVDFWTPGLRLAHGRTADLAEAAAAMAMFVTGAGLRHLGEAWPFVTYGELAEAYERSEADAIAVRWRQLLDPPARAGHLQDLRDVLAAAAEEPRLRALYPFTSHLDLGFRRSVPDASSRALAWVRPFTGGRYLVAGPDRRQLYTEGPVRQTIWGEEPLRGALGPATARESVALILTAMDGDGISVDPHLPHG